MRIYAHRRPSTTLIADMTSSRDEKNFIPTHVDGDLAEHGDLKGVGDKVELYLNPAAVIDERESRALRRKLYWR